MVDYRNIMMRAHLEILDEYLELAEEYGLGIEFGDFCRNDILDDRDEYKRRLAYMKETVLPLSLKRTFHAPFRRIVPHSRDKELRRLSRERLLRGMETAEELACSTVVIHSAYDECNDSPGELKRMRDDFVPFLQKILSDFAPPVALENIHDRNTAFLEMIAEAIDDPRLGFCMDAGHMSAFGQIPYSEWYKTFAGRTIHNHWHDNSGDRDAHGPLGSGSIDWGEMYALRKEFCPDSTVALEIPSGDGIRRSLNTLEREASRYFTLLTNIKQTNS